MFNILLVENDIHLLKLMTAVLKSQNYNVFPAKNGKKVIVTANNVHIDIMICDIMLPELNGYEVTKAIRQTNSSMPVLMVTALETLDDKRRGFEAGTDDYMVKPINTDEMLMRIQALLRRAKVTSERRVIIGNFVADMDSMSIEKSGHCITLPQKEFLLLFKLLSMPKHIFTRQNLLNEIWNCNSYTDERTVDVHIKRVRDRLIEINTDEFDIITVLGLGYKAVMKKQD